MGKTVSNRNLGKIKVQMLIDYYLGDMQRRGCTQDSINTNRHVLKRFVRRSFPDPIDVTLSGVTEEVVESYVSDLHNRKVRWKNHPNVAPVPGKLSPFTIRKDIKVLKGFGTWLEQEGIDNPFHKLAIPKEPKRLARILADEEIDLILKSINPQISTGSRLFAIVLFMLDSGPRISEVANARIPCLDLETRHIRLIGKGNKERIVPFGSRTDKAFLNYIHLHRPAPLQPEFDQLFLSMDGIPMTRQSLTSVIQRLKKSSGVHRLHAHLFRHTFAVKYLMNGGDLGTLQRILGHESLEVTTQYLNLTSARI